MKESLALEFSSKDLEEIERLNYEICSALVGSEQFIQDSLIVTHNYYDPDTETYNFTVYFDEVLIDPETTSVIFLTKKRDLNERNS